jgi:phosphoribosyl 1,2-cyclic phosphodiesterase
MLSVRFWGVRGGIASPGEQTLKFGGNTPCVEIRAGNETFVLDCGTGSRELGRDLMARVPVRVHLLFSDYRWDHIQGFPFFVPVFIPSSEIHVHGPRAGQMGAREMLADQMKFPVFPIQMEHLHAKFTYDTLDPGAQFTVGDVTVTTIAGTDGSLGYRIQRGTHAVVCLPDSVRGIDASALDAFCRKASAIVFDTAVPGSLNGQRTKATRALWDFAVEITRRAKAKRVFLFHHAPDDDDRALIALERRARREFAGTTAAYEGLKFAL